MSDYKKIEKDICFTKFYYTNIQNYYNFTELKQNCFTILKDIYSSINLSTEEKNRLQNILFNTYDEIILLWNFDDITKGGF